MKLGIAEIMKKVSEAANLKERVELLRKHDTPALRAVFEMAYNPEVQWDLGEKWKPDYKPSVYLDQEGYLYQQVKYMAKFWKSSPYVGMTTERKQTLFVQMLEGLDPEDAKLMVAVKDGKIPYKNLGPGTLRQAWPDWLPLEEKKEESYDI